MGDSGYDVIELGKVGNQVCKVFFEENTPPLDTRVRNKPCHKPCMRRSVILTLSGTHGLGISRVTTHGLAHGLGISRVTSHV